MPNVSFSFTNTFKIYICRSSLTDDSGMSVKVKFAAINCWRMFFLRQNDQKQFEIYDFRWNIVQKSTWFLFALGQFHMDICREEQVRQFPTTKFEKN